MGANNPSDDPFDLDSIANTAGTLGSSLEIMGKRQENSPCDNYVVPVKQVVAVARRDMNAPVRPQSAVVDTAGAHDVRLSETGIFTPKKPAEPTISAVPVAATTSPNTDTNSDSESEKSSGMRPG